MKKIAEIIKDIQPVKHEGDVNTAFSGIKYDSREVSEGDLFVAVKGYKTDGHYYIEEASRNGAAAVVLENIDFKPLNIPWILVKDSRAALSRLSASIYGFPSRRIRIIGVTGTNGKTTVTHLIEAVFRHAGRKVGLIGTIENRIDGESVKASFTTPDSLDLQKILSKMRDCGIGTVVMEVSSHALKLKRTADCEFDVAVFTNLTQDHMDFHESFGDYLKSKILLFQGLKKDMSAYAVINIDDKHSGDFIENTEADIYTYGLSGEANYTAEDIKITPHGSSFKISERGEKEDAISWKLIGRFNVYNALAAWIAARKEGIPPEWIKEALESYSGVPGRFQPVNAGQNFAVIIDYAHTPDSLNNILLTAKEVSCERIITVFGCGGDRDRTKRPLMGETAGKHSDYCIITSDNPRSEDPNFIIKDILPGVEKVTSSYCVIENRREAIKKAVSIAEKDDMVIIAGKGHETYQIVGENVLHFDDKEEAEAAVRSRIKND